MMKKIGLLMLIGVCITMTGCVEETSEFFINPDGSGKVIYESTTGSEGIEMMGQMMGDMFGGMGGEMTTEKPDMETILRQHVKELLTQSSSCVDAWKDVSYKLTDDGKMYFKGTAYFSDISKLDVKNGPSSFPITHNEDGNIVIELESQDMGPGGMPAAPAVAPGDLTDEQINQQVQAAKMQYNQMKMMMGSVLSNFKIESTMHLSGTIKEINNFTKVDDHTIRIVMDGAKILKVVDEMMGDEAFLKEQIRQGNNPSDLAGGNDMMAEKVFGQKGPIRVVLTPDANDLFDYAAEMNDAKEKFDDMMKQLDLDGEKSSSKEKNAKPSKKPGREKSTAPMDTEYDHSIAGQMRQARQKELEKDFEAAIQIYEAVSDAPAAEDRQVARACYRIGLCYQKIGDETNAAKYFKRVIADFPAERDAANAQRALDSLGGLSRSRDTDSDE